MTLNRIVIVGASGGIGRALVEQSIRRYPEAQIFAFSRGQAVFSDARIEPGYLDLEKPESIKAAAQTIPDGGLDRVIVASGMLHDDACQPEKSWRDLEADAMLKLYAVNTVGPALVLKHFVPLLHRRKPATFAAVSARVGSISDNRLGGWYSYRASKAALNMVLKSASIEYARKNKEGVIVGLHPGTVDSSLSAPFQANVPEGKLFSPAYSANCLLDVLDELRPEQTGQCFAWDGQPIPA